MSSNSIWSEHVSKDGRRYYYNNLTKKSQWDKPDELKTEQELRIEAKTRWKSYATSDGKVFYYNTETRESVWEVPDEVKQLMNEEDNLAHDIHENTKSAFLSWLENFNFTQKTTWDSAVKVLEIDSKWAMFGILTKGEKKQLFSEFTSQIHRRKQEELRKKKGMLDDIITKELALWDDLNYSTTYVEFAKRFHKAEWWEWSDEKTRDSIFQDYVERMEKELKRRQKERKVSSMDKLIDLMSTNYNNQLKEWTKIKSDYLGFEGLHNIDILNCHKFVFKEIYHQLYKDAEKRSFRLQRKRRYRFIAFLEDCIKKNEITESTKFQDFIKNHSTEAIYVDLVGQPGSTPLDLFLEVQDTLKRKRN